MAQKNSIGDRVRALRERLKWSQADLAREVGVSQPTVLSVETGATKNTKHIPAFAKALRTTVEYLVEGDSERAVAPHVVRVAADKLGNRSLPSSAIPGKVPVRPVGVVGVIQSGAWLVEPIFLRSFAFMPDIPELHGLPVEGFDVGDDQTDLTHPIGSTLLTVEYEHFGRAIAEGDACVLLREKAGKFETLVRHVRAGLNGKMILVPRSSNDKHETFNLNDRNIKAGYLVVGAVTFDYAALSRGR